MMIEAGATNNKEQEMSKTVFHESYGDLPVAEYRAIKKYGVTPADYYMLECEFGEFNHDAITAAILARSASGRYMQPIASW